MSLPMQMLWNFKICFYPWSLVQYGKARNSFFFFDKYAENIINGRKVETCHCTSRVYKGSPEEGTRKKKGKEQTTWLLTNLQNRSKARIPSNES